MIVIGALIVLAVFHVGPEPWSETWWWMAAGIAIIELALDGLLDRRRRR